MEVEKKPLTYSQAVNEEFKGIIHNYSCYYVFPDTVDLNDMPGHIKKEAIEDMKRACNELEHEAS